MENIKISVSEGGREDTVSVVRVDGVIDTLTASQLEEVLERLLKRERFNIILDLAGVDYISSAGWGIFISRIKEVRENRGDIKLANMVPNVKEIYELLEFDNILTSYENLSSAKSSFGGSAGTDPLKKKEPIARLSGTTIEELPGFTSREGGGTAAASRQATSRSYLDETEELVLGAIRQDPFYTIGELKMVLEEAHPGLKIGWWGIFKLLRKNHLVSRRARFRYARQRHHQG